MQDRFRVRVWDIERKEYVYDAQFEPDYDFVVDDKKYIPEQCSGIRDKNGQLIYEGDIVRWYYGNVLIKFSYDDVVSFAGLCGVDEGIEVIGNIHKNPELLGENKDER